MKLHRTFIYHNKGMNATDVVYITLTILGNRLHKLRSHGNIMM